MAAKNVFSEEIKVEDLEKNKVWVECDHNDFKKYFPIICKLVNDCQECFFYQQARYNKEISEEQKKSYIRNCDVLIFVVTEKSLKSENAAVKYALDNNIPIVPIDVESDQEKEVDLSDKFNATYGAIHMLKYRDKTFKLQLENTLNSIFINEETKERVKAAFAAYIFLSYRKKDKEYVEKLREAFYQIRGCWDVAIWFDDYLIAGENFDEIIEFYINKSNVFTLLVTPHILETPNYVLDNEYKAVCCKEKVDILPVEMEKTDKDDLYEKYKGLPACLDFSEDSFLEYLWKIISQYKVKENDDPAHKFLIGLANVYGINTKNRKTEGYNLLTVAANEGYYEAIDKVLNFIEAGVEQLRRTISEEKIFEWRMKKVTKLKELYESDYDRLSVLKELCDFVLRSVYTDNKNECEELEPVLIKVSETYTEFLFELAELYGRYSFDFCSDELKYFEIYKKRESVLLKLEEEVKLYSIMAVHDENGKIIIAVTLKDVLEKLFDTYDVLNQLSTLVSLEEVEKYRIAAIDCCERIIKLPDATKYDFNRMISVYDSEAFDFPDEKKNYLWKSLAVLEEKKKRFGFDTNDEQKKKIILKQLETT